MKLLADARALQEHVDGIGRHILGILGGLARVRPGWELEALVLPDAVRHLDRIPVRTIHCPVPRFRREERRRVTPLVESSGADFYMNFSMAGPCPGIPTGISVYDMMVLNLPGYFGPLWIRNILARMVFRRMIFRSAAHAALIAVPSLATRDEFETVFPGCRDRIRVTGEGQDLFPPGGRPAWTGEAGYLLYVGNARAYKNLSRLLVAYARLRATGAGVPPLVMVVRRDRAYRGFMRELEDSPAREAVTVVSSVEDDRLRELYAGAAGLLMPSLKEGFGFPVLEAMSAGTPVVVSAGTALEELAGEAGILVDPLSVADMMRGIALLVSDGGLRAGMSGRCLARAAGYTWDAAAERLAEAVEEIMNKGSSRPR
ncbi:MAG: hypothetical protein AVO35_07725 [Candidatus Aegiribacteria sp. MLS_C]|nr:MAG: hypothetical protein AVO35_07725 [Candidatus Aegiribacteria sp. MLS_C]